MSTHTSPESTRISQPSNSRKKSSRNALTEPHLTLGDPGLLRHGTLLTSNATPAQAAAELKSILGNHNSRLKSKAALIRLDSGSAMFNRHVILEQAKSRARVEVDILPQTNICVQGGYLHGHIKILIRSATYKEGSVFIAGGKIRAVGFESLGDKSQSIFYQCSALLASVTPNLEQLYASEPDVEGFMLASEGVHEFPFALYLSPSNDHGRAKGFLRNHPGIGLNYIAMVSLKIKDELGRRSIAHFYRSIEVWPRLDPTAILSTALRPLQATVSKNISKESDAGRIKLMASLHRLYWIAGQFCQVKVIVHNDTTRLLKRLTVSLHRTITIFPQASGGNSDSNLAKRQPEVVAKQVAECVLEAGQSRSRGHASAKGWWLGVSPQRNSEFEHSLLIPVDTLTVTHGRIFEVQYSLRVAIDSGTRFSSDIQVSLPIRIVGFYSIDPPPFRPINVQSVAPLSSRSSSPRYNSKTNTLNRSCPLSCSKKSQETPNRISIGQKTRIDNDSILLHDSHSVSHERDSHELFSDRSGEMGILELGNLSLADDTDEVVQHAIAAVRMNSTFGHFSDLYYLQDKINQIETDGAFCDDRWENFIDDLTPESPVETSVKEIELENFPDMNVYDVEVTQALEVHRRSSFAVRVEEKTRVATATFLNGNHDVHIDQEEDTLKNDEESQRNRKPHLTLKVSPKLYREITHRSEELPRALNTQFGDDGSRGIQVDSWNDENSSNAPTQSDHSHSPATMRASPKRHRKASTIDSSTSATLSQIDVCPPLVPPAYQGQSKSMATISAPICSHCVMHMSDNLTPRGTTSIKNICRQDAPISETEKNDDLTSPCSIIGIANTATVSPAALVSPASATSTTSVTCAGSVSVKDKVRRLEERVKASIL